MTRIFALLLSVLILLPGIATAADEEYQYSGEKMASFLFMKHAADRKDQLIESMGNWAEQQTTMWQSLTKGQGWEGFTELATVLFAMMVAGLLVEALAVYKLRSITQRISQQNCEVWHDSLGFLVLRSILSLIGLAVFALVAYTIPISLYGTNDIFEQTLTTLLDMIISVRAFAIVAQLFWAPNASGIRLMKMECGASQDFYRWTVGFVALYYVSTTSWSLMFLHGIDPIMFALVVPFNGLVLNLLAVYFVFSHKITITNLFTNGNTASSTFTQFLRQSWPGLVTIWLLILWFIWATNEFLGYYTQADHITPAWWLTLSFPFADRILYMLMSRLKSISWLQSRTFERRCDRFIHRTLIAFRTILVAAVMYHVINTIGYDTLSMLTEQLGHYFNKFIDVFIVLIIAYATWEIIQSAIERHLPDVDPEEENGMASLEGEGGGAGASRSETLLPLVRSFMLVFLIVTVSLTILSILGVEIAPLLAGAGIIGIAVGFGAQKLVQDVISGIFFLLDDAFRRGEYIEAAGLRGTVERISIRSIRLRHHLGAVQTIPFSEMATITNLSRDWITMKLEFRLAYDTDVEKVRKIIKKVGQSMLEHEEYGPHFLLPLKSQGVIRVEESALIFRMKFTCVPGEQWIIRREAYRLVKEALSTNGIEFAHRSVHVLLPEHQPREKEIYAGEGQLLENKAIGAAALEGSAELRRQDKIDDDKANVIGADSDSV
ncbi:MAG: mechanosensitive ion channel family protein [Amphritea sp.]|nr:mechanosensitive ion channel family protein [Amphritea sp.]